MDSCPLTPHFSGRKEAPPGHADRYVVGADGDGCLAAGVVQPPVELVRDIVAPSERVLCERGDRFLVGRNGGSNRDLHNWSVPNYIRSGTEIPRRSSARVNSLRVTATRLSQESRRATSCSRRMWQCS